MRDKQKNKTAQQANNYLESIHMLVNVIEKQMDEGHNCLVFTSYLDQQGKTYAIKEVGKTLAEANYKTLIIDCNIMAPSLSEAYNEKQGVGEKGFLDFIDMGRERNEKITYSEVIPYINNREVQNLYFIPIRKNFSKEYIKHIRKEEVADLFHILKDKFEVVLIEAPSFQNLSYAQSIIEASDGYFLMIKSGTISKGQVYSMKEKMNQMTMKSLGVIFNKMTT